MKGNAFRNGRVHVCREMCSTCIFRPGNLMDLNPGRVQGMIRDSVRKQSAIICHQTLDGDEAVCRGFYDQHKTQPLQIAERLELVTEIVPKQSEAEAES